MPVGITDLAHSFRKNTADSAEPIPLSRGQQLVCAALGHKSFASFQASQATVQEPQSLDHVAHVVPDYECLTVRAAELGLVVPDSVLRRLLRQAFEERLPRTRVHHSYDSLAGTFRDEMEAVVMANGEVNSQMSDANYDGIDEVYFEADLEPDQVPADEPLTVTVSGQVNLGIDTERPYSGHQVKVKVQATMQRCGRRCFDRPSFEVLSAVLDQDWGDRDEHEPPPTKTLAEALAEELKITVAEAEELTDAEAQDLTGNSGEMTYSYLFDFTKHASPALAAKLMKLHGSLQLEVGPWFFDAIHGPDEPN